MEPYGKPSEIPALVLTDYTKWRRTKNWDKSKHRNNHNPPTDQTINKELTDFKGFFDWCKSKKIYVQDIEYAFRKIDWNGFFLRILNQNDVVFGGSIKVRQLN